MMHATRLNALKGGPAIPPPAFMQYPCIYLLVGLHACYNNNNSNILDSKYNNINHILYNINNNDSNTDIVIIWANKNNNNILDNNNKMNNNNNILYNNYYR